MVGPIPFNLYTLAIAALTVLLALWMIGIMLRGTPSVIRLVSMACAPVAVGIAGKLRGDFFVRQIMRIEGTTIGLDYLHAWVAAANATLWFGVGGGVVLFTEALCLAFVVSRRGQAWK